MALARRDDRISAGRIGQEQRPIDKVVAYCPPSDRICGGSSRFGHAPDPEKWIEEWEQRTAATMLQDLEKRGVDQDLEELRAGWSTPAVRQSAAQASKLNRRGNLAKRRIGTRDCLQQVADGKVPTQALRGAEDLSNAVPGCLLSLQDASSAAASRGSGSSQAALACPGASQGDRSAARGSRQRPSDARGRNSAAAAASEQRSPWQLHTGGEEEDDEWAAWERSWAEAFKEMEQTQRARGGVRSRTSVGSERGSTAEEQQQQQPRQASRPGSASGSGARAYSHSHGRAKEPAPPSRGPRRSSSRGPGPEPQGRAQESAPPPRGPQRSSSRGPGPAGGASGAGPPPRASAGGGAPPRGPPPAPPAPPPVPAPPAPQAPRFANFGAYQEAWKSFETSAMASSQSLRYADVPWPSESFAVSGIDASDGASERKKKLRSALLRWHPDKWGPLLERVVEADKPRVMEQVKEITRRILTEKESCA